MFKIFFYRILAKKTLKKYNYWRQVLRLVFFPKRTKLVNASRASCACQVACYSAPCEADPSCHGDDGPPDDEE